MRQEGTPLSFCLTTPFCKKYITVYSSRSQTEPLLEFLKCVNWGCPRPTEWVLQLSAPYLQVWGCLCGRGPHWAECCPQQKTPGSFEVQADTPFLAGTKLVLFCIKKKRGCSQLRCKKKSHKIQKILRLPTNLPLWNMRKDPQFSFLCLSPCFMPKSHSLWLYPHCLHSSSHFLPHLLRAHFVRMHCVRCQEHKDQ